MFGFGATEVEVDVRLRVLLVLEEVNLESSVVHSWVRASGVCAQKRRVFRVVRGYQQRLKNPIDYPIGTPGDGS